MDIAKGIVVGVIVVVICASSGVIWKWWCNRRESRPIHPHVAGGSMENETDEQRQARHEREMIESDDPEIWKPLR